MNPVNFFKENLWFQIMLILSGAMVLVISTMILLNLSNQNRVFMEQVKDQAEKMAEIVEGAMDDALAVGNNDSVRAQFKRLKEKMQDVDIFVYDFNGDVSFATDIQTLGKSLDTLVKNRNALTANSHMLISGVASGEVFNEKIDGKLHMNLFRPILNESRCYHCHGSSRNVLGGIMIKTLVDNQLQAIRSSRNKSIMIGFIGILVLVLIIYALFNRMITRPLNKLLDITAEIAKGNLAARVTVNGRDEVSHVCNRINDLGESLGKMFRDIRSGSETLSMSSTEMSEISHQMSSASEETSTQSNTVASATEEMSASINAIASAAEQMSVNIQGVSSSAEQMSQNMNAVATAIEEMSTSISDVSGSAKEGAVITGEAAEMSVSTSDTMSILGDAAKEIGEVTEVIKQIAEQTNLLALNATIEAASAGDAGRGFAVVANEIKELANQSARAAEDIARRIEGIQTKTEEAVRSIAGISNVINRVNESAEVITKSVEQQTLSANEISGNVQEANTGTNNIALSIAEIAKGANDMAKSAAEAAKGVNEVSANIQGVSQAADDTSTGARKVDVSAEEVARIATQIQEMVGKFRV
ncbi:methyl-accepting chemotaxis protein [Thermodesulfobacteriota bacterium]